MVFDAVFVVVVGWRALDALEEDSLSLSLDCAEYVEVD